MAGMNTHTMRATMSPAKVWKTDSDRNCLKILTLLPPFTFPDSISMERSRCTCYVTMLREINWRHKDDQKRQVLRRSIHTCTANVFILIKSISKSVWRWISSKGWNRSLFGKFWKYLLTWLILAERTGNAILHLFLILIYTLTPIIITPIIWIKMNICYSFLKQGYPKQYALFWNMNQSGLQ